MANVKISELNSLNKKAYNDVVPIVDTSANETKKVSIEELVNNNVSLIAVDSEAPEECVEGDKYFNTTTNLIYTATDTDTWSSTGESPIEGIFYIVFEEQTTYAYNGTTLISVGGGAGGGGDNEPIGKVVPMVLETAPDGYLLCDGSLYTKAQYPDLFKIMKNTVYQTDDEEFQVPNIQGKVIVGKNASDSDFSFIGKNGGSKYLQAHTHGIRLEYGATVNADYPPSSGARQEVTNNTDYPYRTYATETTGTGDSGNLQPYIVLNYFIKAQKTSGDVILSESLPVGTEVDFDGQASDIPVGWEEVESYSTSEVKTADNWIDDKPIYRKVVNFGSLPNATSKNVSHNISNLENMINIKGWTKRDDGTTFPLPYESGTNISENIALFTNNTNISIYCGTNRTEFSTTYIILEYTKTTD